MRPLIVEPGLGRVRLEDFLERHWPDADRRFWRRVLTERAVTVNGNPATPQQRLRVGDFVEVKVAEPDIPRRPGADAAATPSVLVEDDHVLVVDKPPGMHTVPDRGGKYLGVYGLLERLRPDADLRIVHRLDAPTSGCLALAKGLEAARFYDRAFRAGEVRKQYAALVAGVPRRARQEIDRPLGPDRRRPGLVRVVEAGARGARAARTVVETVEVFRRFALLRVSPETGRSHQIRVHLLAAGLPIVGDPDYGPAPRLLLSDVKPDYKLRPGARERPLLDRMFLHAERLDLPTPAGGRLVAEAPLPPELTRVIEKLRRFAPRRDAR